MTRSTEQVAAGKPSPLVYQEVAEQLGLAPGSIVAIEDSSNGLRSASRAGMHVIAAPRPQFPPAPDALAVADKVVEQLDDVTLNLVESLSPAP